MTSFGAKPLDRHRRQGRILPMDEIRPSATVRVRSRLTPSRWTDGDMALIDEARGCSVRQSRLGKTSN